MPEGPELARSRDFLRELLLGKELVGFELTGGRYAKEPPPGMADFGENWIRQGPTFIDGVDVKGKFMYWTLQPLGNVEPWFLWCTYGMSGMWTTQPADKHVAVTVTAGPPDRAVHFRDPRHFGTLKFVRGRGPLEKKLRTLGPDMLNDPPKFETFVQRLDERADRTLAEALMDQSVVSGVGNYVKAESLYRARLSPHRVVNDVSVMEMAQLYDAVFGVMRDSYQSGGATIATYRQGDGGPGEAQERFVCYGRKVDPGGNPIVSEETKDGRTTWWCPTVQK